jgi:hypothetical protein
MMLLPLVVLGAWWAIRLGTPVRRAWIFPAIAAVALVGSAFAALETGEAEEDRAENAVGEHMLQPHEEAAERFLVLSGGVAVLMLAGFLRGRVGQSARALGGIAALALIIAGYQVGHSGGRIVYGDGTTPGISAISSGQAGSGDSGEAATPGADDD